MQIEMKSVNELVPYENNPRNNESAVDAVAESIREFGFKQPIVVDANNIVIAGHTRLKASKKLGLKEVPCIIADDLTEEQIKAFRLVDNKTGELAEWDFEALSAELEELSNMNFDMSDYGFDEIRKELGIEEDEENPYTQRIEAPFYKPTGNKVEIAEMVDTSKSDELISKIRQAKVPPDIEKFLITASYRHIVFDYGKIADYYSNANKEVQKLFEDSALVIIDFDDAIKNGFVKLVNEIRSMIEEEEEEDGNIYS